MRTSPLLRFLVVAASISLCWVNASQLLPPFSWNTLPVAFHSSSSHLLGFSSAQIQELSRYSMVTIEKFQGIAAVAPAATLAQPYLHGLYACQKGADLSRCGCCAEDEIVEAARKIKAANASVLTVAYLNTQIAMNRVPVVPVRPRDGIPS